MRTSRLARWRRSFGARRGPRYVYVSYHKCATQFTAGVLGAVCAHHGLRAASFDSRHAVVSTRELARLDFLMLTDYSSPMVDLASLDARGIYVIRDPRDILVSMYYSHRSSHPANHPEIMRNRTALKGVDVAEGLRWLMDESSFFHRIVREMDDWDPEPGRFRMTTFTRLTEDPDAELSAMLSFLDLPVPEPVRREILDRHSFSELKRRWAEANPGAQHNHYRSGISGDWRTHLTGATRDAFRELHGPLLIKLGFETDLDW